MSAIKLCRDCKHREWLGWLLSSDTTRCKSPRRTMEINPVSGKQVPQFTFCTTLRGRKNDCGPEAKWFQPKDAA